MMDYIKRSSLQRQWDCITEDLNVDHILDELYSLQIVSTNDLEKIRSKGPRKDQTSCLLDIISKKDNRAYDNFVNVLQKDYNWLARALQDVNENYDGFDRHEQVAFEDSLVLGNVPRRPPHYVDRTSPLEDLRTRLKDLEPFQRIVLHGMTGSGKSCLAAAAVKDPSLLQTCFNNRVFWINLGEIKAVDQLPMHMNLLYQRLLNDNREVNNKSRPVSFTPQQEGDNYAEVELLKDALKNVLRTDSYREALLVLDNVSLPEAVGAFDLGCKTLITTQAKDIIACNSAVYVEVKGGFTELETLTLFAKSLETQLERLPVQATRIHYLCKGEPILIALIGSLLATYKEELLANSDSWEDYIIKRLTKKDYNLKAQLFGAISICIERLSPELRDLYQYFAVFVEDVNITPEVMQTLWKLDNKSIVQEKMKDLRNKSLIVSYYNQELKTYVYGVHDLFLACLKERLKPDELIQKHRTLISAYKHISNNNFANLPNDNYIFQYIGYHLKEAQLYDEFAIYFDLNFIGAKIRAIGTADLLRDFHLYKVYITRNDETLNSKLDEYIHFVKAKGHDLFKYRDTDIIQCGLGQEKGSSVYKAALAIAKQNPNNLYLKLQAPQESVYFTHTLDLRQDVTAACFTLDVNQVLVGMRNGDINLWEQAYHQKLNVFSGHTGSISFLQLSPDGKGFLSVSEEDGCVKIWSLQGVVLRNSNGDVCDENGFNKNIPSPRVKQSNWTNFYGSNGRVDRSKTCRLDNDRLISASYANETEGCIVTGCFSGKVLIWNILTEEPSIVLTIEVEQRNFPANCVTFSADDSVVIFSLETNIYLYSAENGEYLSELRNNAYINSLLIVPELDTALIAINNSTITMWTWSQIGIKVSHPVSTLLDNRGSAANFLCGAVTEDGAYLVAGSTDYYIRVWHIGTATIAQEILNNKGLVVCLDTFYNSTKNAVHILLSGSDDKTVKQWHIQPAIQNVNTAKLLPIFDCFWNASGVPRIAVVNSLNKVQVMNAHNILVESDRMKSPIKAVRFSLCGNKVAIGLENGDVWEFDYKNRNYGRLMTLHDSVVLIKYFNTSNECQTCSRTDLSPDSSILVCTARNGWVTIYKNGAALCLVQPPLPSNATNITIKQVPVIPIVQCFYIKAADQLLSVSENRTIKLWNLLDGTYRILFGDKGHQNEEVSNSTTVTMATLSKDQSLLAITMADGCFEIYCISVSNTVISLNYNQGKSLSVPLRSCRFSYNGKILAVGQDNGDIVIWSIESKVALSTLKLHKTWVRYLLFAPSPALILISVGDQIAWWDLTKLQSELQNQDRFRRRSNSAKKKNLTIDVTAQMSNLNLGMWSDKQGRPDKPHLLSSIKVRGLHSTYISASQDFTSFFTIDRNGYLYIMEMLKQGNV